MENEFHKELIAGYIKKFKKSEEDFVRSIQDSGCKVSFSETSENTQDHWDVKLELKFDVKAIKKVRRNDDAVDESIHWVEIKNINGFSGWLYGKADYFSFETNDYWVLVPKENLQKLIAEKCSAKIICAKPELYKLYTRDGRKDVVTLVKTIDLIYVSDKLISKK